ncbi:MAG: hypothetical protein L6R38_007957 [Xanthoria sp. 2 TBL-2021]|nr:MAG: hypothetical protein L6R38_007957 [Xanthoria sp. 2 TBL-2021]
MAESIPPPGVDLSADQGGRIVASMAALIVLPTLAVLARLTSRQLAHAGFWYDDLWVVIALSLSYGPIICVLVSQSTNRFGRHIWALGEGNSIQFLRILYIYEVFYYASCSAIKICILLFYRRIFPVREIKLVLQIATAAVVAFFLGSLLSTLFQCTPIHKFWHRNAPGHCTNGNHIIIVPGAINTVLDFIIIGLPLPLLWKLRTTTSQKSVLTGIFICAGFVCIISIIRLVVLSRLENEDVTWNYVNSAIWSAAEPCMGVISACLPSLRPLVALMTRGTHRAPKIGGKSAQATTSSGSSRVVWRRKDTDHGKHFSRLEDSVAEQARWGHDVTVKGGRETDHGSSENISLQEINVPPGQIKVKEEIVVTSTDWLDYKDRVY